MRSIFILSLFFLFQSCTSKAQLTSTDEVVIAPAESTELEVALHEETANTVLVNDSLVFVTNFDVAKEQAQAMNGQILMVFAGSDWCRPCKQFKASILQDKTFNDSLKDKLIVLYLDFPSKRANKLPAEEAALNDALAAKFNPMGVFPHIILMDSAGEPIEILEFKGQGSTDFIATIEEINLESK